MCIRASAMDDPNKRGRGPKKGTTPSSAYLHTIVEVEDYFINTTLINPNNRRGGTEQETQGQVRKIPLKTGFIDTGAFTHSFMNSKQARKVVDKFGGVVQCANVVVDAPFTTSKAQPVLGSIDVIVEIFTE